MNELSSFLAELIGTTILILLGIGVVANVKLERSGMQNGILLEQHPTPWGGAEGGTWEGPGATLPPDLRPILPPPYN